MTRDPYGLGRGNVPLCPSPVRCRPVRPNRRDEMRRMLSLLTPHLGSERAAFDFCRRFAGVSLQIPPAEVVDELARAHATPRPRN